MFGERAASRDFAGRTCSATRLRAHVSPPDSPLAAHGRCLARNLKFVERWPPAPRRRHREPARPTPHQSRIRGRGRRPHRLLRAQKAAAWQEVAQRIAHEIKNPLTPIQLSAERLLRHLARSSPSRRREDALSNAPQLGLRMRASDRARSRHARMRWSTNFRNSRASPSRASLPPTQCHRCGAL